MCVIGGDENNEENKSVCFFFFLLEYHSIMGNLSTCSKFNPSRHSPGKPIPTNNNNHCIHHDHLSVRRKNPSSSVPTDAEIVDIHALRCSVSSKEINDDDLSKQLNYIQSFVRKDKGLLGKSINTQRHSSICISKER